MAEINNVVEMNGSMPGNFDPNEGAPEGGAILPSIKGMDAELTAYTNLIEQVIEGSAPKGTFLEQVMGEFSKATAKAISVPSNFLTYARMTYMPDTTGSNILPWPGVNPESLKKIIMENVAPNMIINMRIDDIIAYSQQSEHVWRPGWRMELAEGNKQPSSQDKKDMKEASRFLNNSSIDFNYNEALDRDTQNLSNFQTFLSAAARDSLSFDLIAVSTDRDKDGRIVQYGLVPAANIRICGLPGYENDPEKYAVAVDEGGTVIRAYTRKELLLYIRNPRTDPEHTITMTRGYGTPEIQTAMKLIQIFQNVLDFNSDIFQRSGVPHGMLLLTGNGWTQKQVDVLTRMWHNLKKGITKALALPVLAAPKDGKVEVVDFSRIKGDEAFYQDLLNLSIGCFCVVFRFPVKRFGYRITGNGPVEGQRHGDKATPGSVRDDEDSGLVALLIHLENLVNQYLVCPRWPTLRFRFTGKEPKSDAREYEARKLAQTWGEARAEADLKPLVELDTVKQNQDLKELAQIMDMAPTDPNLGGLFSSIVSAWMKGEAREGEDIGSFGNNMTSSKDPARSEAHGKLSGVRRDSAAEKEGSTAH